MAKISKDSEFVDFNKAKTIQKAMIYLYQDTTIQKASNDRTKADRMIEVVRNKERKLHSQREVRKITEKRRKIQED